MVKRILMMLSIAIFFLLFAEVIYLRLSSHSSFVPIEKTHASVPDDR